MSLFAQKVHTTFEVLKAHNWAKGLDNNHTPLLAHPAMGKYYYMPPANTRFGFRDF